MNKKIKLLISLMFIISVLIIFNNNVKALTVYTRETTGTYSPDGFYPRIQYGIPYYCAESGGSLSLYSEGEKSDLGGMGKSFWEESKESNVFKAINKEESIKNTIDEYVEEIESYLLNNFNFNTMGIKKGDWDSRFETSRANYTPKSKTKNVKAIFNQDADGNWNYQESDLNSVRRMAEYESDYYAGVPTYQPDGNPIVNENDRIAYILSTGENIPDTPGTDKDNKGTNYIKSQSDIISELPHEDGTHYNHKEPDTDTYYEDAIQHALWRDTEGKHNAGEYYFNDGTDPRDDRDTYHLYEEAVAYENFYNDIKNNQYTAEFKDVTNIKIIVNRNDKTYTVGPFTLNYLDSKDSEHKGKFSYIENMWLSNQKGDITYDFEIIKRDMSDTALPYPASGEEFFVKFKADKLDYPTSIDVHAEFNYLDKTYAKYQKLSGTGNYYQDKAFIDWKIVKTEGYTVHGEKSADTSNNTTDNNLTGTSVPSSYFQGVNERNGTIQNSNGTYKKIYDYYWYHKYTQVGDAVTTTTTTTNTDGTPTTTTTTTYTYKHEKIKYDAVMVYKYSFDINNPEVGLDDENVCSWRELVKNDDGTPKTYVAQTTAKLLEVDRQWKTVTANSGDKFKINLYTQVAGYVWVDEGTGKESGFDGYYDTKNEKPMPKVEVVLYRYEDNTIMGTKFTDDKGHYEFNKLNPFSQYYVRFKYNAQYYEPTYYTDPTKYETKIDENGNTIQIWKNNSNGTDYQKNYYSNKVWYEGRTTINAKFASINSSTANYEIYDINQTNGETVHTGKYNETFSKKELLGYTLNEKGEYVQTREAVIDEFGRLIIESSSDATTQKMIQYVKDCTMYSWSKNVQDIIDRYPYDNIYVIEYKYERNKKDPIEITIKRTGMDEYEYTWNGLKGKNGVISVAKDDKSQYINQGYKARQQADISLRNDVDHVTLEINGKTQKYEYDTRNAYTCNSCGHHGKIEELKEGTDESGFTVYKCVNCESTDIKETWDIDTRISDVAYYNSNYSREIYPSDYNFRISQYGSNPEDYGKSSEDELKVYVTYKLTIKNQAMSIRTRIDEIVDYYDTDYVFVEDRSNIVILRGTNKGTYDIGYKNTSIYGNNNEIPQVENGLHDIPGYNKLYVKGLDNIWLNGGDVAYVYLTFEVVKVNDYIKLDEDISTGTAIGVGKENIAEINGYSTRYKQGTVIPNAGTAGAEKVAGIVDTDSNPGNLKAEYTPKDGTIQYNKFEDDTDKAPNIRLVLNRGDNNARITSGYVWEDIRNKINNDQATSTGNGIRDNGDKPINGVTVQLVEVTKDKDGNDVEYVWREFGSTITGTGSIGNGTGSGLGNQDGEKPIIDYNGLVGNKGISNEAGKYLFHSFVPGDYIVRFIYGDSDKTVLTSSSNIIAGRKGENDTSYNGQDYKSTTYQAGVEVKDSEGKVIKDTTYNGENTYKSYTYDILSNDIYKESTGNLVSDAKDIWSDTNTKIVDKSRPDDTLNSRQDVIKYSRNNWNNNNPYGEIRNSFAEKLASYMRVPEAKENITDYLREFTERTQMTAETGIIDIEVEKITKENQQDDNTKQYTVKYSNIANYHIENLDLGLEERPKAQIEITKRVANLKITLANGNVLFDATQGVDNLAWIKADSRYNQIENGPYVNNLMNSEKYSAITNIENSRKALTKELVQPTIDKELMHGAKVTITYDITATNIGETDYNEQQFYYTGVVGNPSNIVTTTAVKLVDYVPNNLQYNDADNNKNWQAIKADDLTNSGNSSLVNEKLKDKLKDYNTIIVTTDNSEIKKGLVPLIYSHDDNTGKATNDSSVTIPLVLTQLITSENKDDDLDYTNKVEMVTVSNGVGRKMEYSIVGNQDPTADNMAELDADLTEVRLLPPFGATLTYIMIALITVAGASIIVAGIVFIKKKVLVK